ncbi:MAG TPA: tRNA (adenosine(37)-N6)-dimethylallyltransferase MiaA [Thermoanaerobaculia bacterium]|nr:tRNA (adenosine(37)-N6)-dimethylallyltransferase MiaA [Thermoanaerobaculia bacterium]
MSGVLGSVVKVVVVAGPTGAGKSRLAVRLAESAGGEIVNYDSVQIYRGFDIGSAKPSLLERQHIPHHLFDIIDAGEEFNAADYARRADEVCSAIASRGRVPILAGGTFFYLRALLSGLPEIPGRNESIRKRIRAVAEKGRGPLHLHRWLTAVDPATASKVAAADRHRVERALEVWISAGVPISEWSRPSGEESPPVASLKIALKLDRAEIVRRIDERVEEMYRGGLVDETQRLLARYPREARPFGAIGYREAAAVVHGERDLPSAIAETKRRTRAYAKRQMTWLRSERNVQWIDATDEEETFRAALRLVERFQT